MPPAGELTKQVDQMHEVARLNMQGKNLRDIAAELGLRRIDAERLLNEWHVWLRETAEKNVDIRSKIIDILTEADQHYALLIKEAWTTAEQADAADQFNTKVQSLKLAASITKDRVGMYQTAGINQDSNLAAELAEAEQQQEAIKAILKEVSSKCSDCKMEVARRLAALNSQAEVIEVEGGSLESST